MCLVITPRHTYSKHNNNDKSTCVWWLPQGTPSQNIQLNNSTMIKAPESGDYFQAYLVKIYNSTTQQL